MPVAWALDCRRRAAWTAIGLAITLYWLGDLYWNTYMAAAKDPSYPSWADAGWVAFYISLYAGLILMLRARVRGLAMSVWLEGIVGALALASVGATVVFDPLRGIDPRVLLDGRNDLAYPTADALLLAIVAAGFGLQRERVGASWMLLGGALSLFAIGDSIYLLPAAKDAYTESGLVNVTWPFAMALTATGAWMREPARSAATDGEHRPARPVAQRLLRAARDRCAGPRGGAPRSGCRAPAGRRCGRRAGRQVDDQREGA